jgi:hypothetical protein
VVIGGRRLEAAGERRLPHRRHVHVQANASSSGRERSLRNGYSTSPRSLTPGGSDGEPLEPDGWNPTIRVFSARMPAAGKPKKLALVAAARKRLGILNAMVRDGTLWDPPAAESAPTP